ncbi:MAG TPA: zinc-dependent alcohol dehydrogenase [Gammaproteobacteria bacterium]
MKANCWIAPRKVEIHDVPEPRILNRRDAILKVSSTAICGSDLHLYNGFVPTMMPGDVLGHEFMGEVVELGPDVRNLKVGDRVVVAFPIACGRCGQCRRELYSLCENSNPNAWIAEKQWGYSPCGIYGYSHTLGGFAGGQAQYVRVPYADVGALPIDDDSLPDESVLFLSDIFPTGFMGADLCGIRGGETVAVWGCGPVGLFAVASAYLLGAERVIAIDRFDYRLQMAREKAGAETLNYEEVDVHAALRELTGGRGPDHCIDAVGMEAHSHTPMYPYDRIKQALMLETDRPIALRQAVMACRSGGTVSVIGVYAGLVDKFPMGAVMNRSLAIRAGQCHVQKYMRPLLERIQNREIDPSFVITHRMSLDEAPAGFDMFAKKRDGCEKIVLAAN